MQDSLHQLEYLPVSSHGECTDSRRGWRDYCYAWGRVAGVATLVGAAMGMTMAIFAAMVLASNISP